MPKQTLPDVEVTYVSTSNTKSDCCGKDVEIDQTDIGKVWCKHCGEHCDEPCTLVFSSEWKSNGTKPKDYSWVLRRIVDVLFIPVGASLVIAYYRANYNIHTDALGNIILFIKG